jgi:hypothetical protein
MRQEPDSKLSTDTPPHPNYATHEVFDEIEAYCRTRHFTIFHGAVQEEGSPQAVWNLEQNPRWEDFLDVAEALEVRVVYLDHGIFTMEHLSSLISRLRRRADRPKFAGYAPYVGITCYIEIAFLHEDRVHTYLQLSEWYSNFIDMVEATPLKEG